MGNIQSCWNNFHIDVSELSGGRIRAPSDGEVIEGKHLLLHLFLIWRPGALLVDLGRVIIANKSI